MKYYRVIANALLFLCSVSTGCSDDDIVEVFTAPDAALPTGPPTLESEPPIPGYGQCSQIHLVSRLTVTGKAVSGPRICPLDSLEDCRGTLPLEHQEYIFYDLIVVPDEGPPIIFYHLLPATAGAIIALVTLERPIDAADHDIYAYPNGAGHLADIEPNAYVTIGDRILDPADGTIYYHIVAGGLFISQGNSNADGMILSLGPPTYGCDQPVRTAEYCGTGSIFVSPSEPPPTTGE